MLIQNAFKSVRLVEEHTGAIDDYYYCKGYGANPQGADKALGRAWLIEARLHELGFKFSTNEKLYIDDCGFWSQPE